MRALHRCSPPTRYWAVCVQMRKVHVTPRAAGPKQKKRRFYHEQHSIGWMCKCIKRINHAFDILILCLPYFVLRWDKHISTCVNLWHISVSGTGGEGGLLRFYMKLSRSMCESHRSSDAILRLIMTQNNAIISEHLFTTKKLLYPIIVIITKHKSREKLNQQLK